MARNRKLKPGTHRFGFRDTAVKWLQDVGFIYYHNVGWCHHAEGYRAQVEFVAKASTNWAVTIWPSLNLPPVDAPRIERRIS